MGKGIQRMIGYVLLPVLACLPIFAKEGPVKIQIEENVTVNEGTVHLSDVATFQEATPDEEKLLDAVDLGKAPAAGQSRSMTRQFVSFKLAQAGFQTEEFQLEMPDQVKVTGAGIQLTPEILRRLMEDSVRSQVPGQWSSWDLQFNGRFNKRWVPPGELSAELEKDSDLLTPGTNLLQIKVLTDGKPVLRLAVAIRINATGKVPIVATDLERHSLLPASAVTWEERPLKGRECLTLAEDGLRTTKRLKKGDVITQTDVEMAPLVKQGEKVQIVCQSAGAAVMVYGIARTDGWLGETINVENIDSQKTLSATVVAEGRVEVK